MDEEAKERRVGVIAHHGASRMGLVAMLAGMAAMAMVGTEPEFPDRPVRDTKKRVFDDRELVGKAPSTPTRPAKRFKHNKRG